MTSNATTKSMPARSTSIIKPPVQPRKTNLELLYARRASVREQKRIVIAQNLAFFPTRYFWSQIVALCLIASVVIAVQIAIIVRRTPLYFVCSGFWSGAILLLSAVSLYILDKRRTSDLLHKAMALHLLAFLASLAGLVAINSIDIAYGNVECIFACSAWATQYLSLIMAIFGCVAAIDIVIFALVIDRLVVRESRVLNQYLENRK